MESDWPRMKHSPPREVMLRGGSPVREPGARLVLVEANSDCCNLLYHRCSKISIGLKRWFVKILSVTLRLLSCNKGFFTDE